MNLNSFIPNFLAKYFGWLLGLGALAKLQLFCKLGYVRWLCELANVLQCAVGC
jgi:hypothetical protein